MLPFDVESYPPGDSEYGAGKRVLKRPASHFDARFADYWESSSFVESNWHVVRGSHGETSRKVGCPKWSCLFC